MIYCLVHLVDHDGIFNSLTGPLISSFAINETFLDAASKHQHRATVREMAVHAIVSHFGDDIRLRYLLLYLGVGAALHHHIPAEFACQNYERPVELARAVKVLDKLC